MVSLKRIRRAFSLLETLIVLALVSIAALAMIAVFLNGHRLVKRGEELTVSAEYAMEILQNSRALDFAVIPLNRTFRSGQNQETLEGFPPLPYGEKDTPSAVVETKELSPTLTSIVVRVEQNGGSELVFETYLRP